MQSLFSYVQAFEKPFERLLAPHCWIVVRLDGNRFTPLTTHLKKPVDDRLRSLFVQTARQVLEKENSLCMAYCQSDEISFVVNKNSDWFSRRQDKIISHLSSSYASHFTRNAIESHRNLFKDPCVEFDAKVVCLHDWFQLRDYLRWRQWQGWRNYISGLIYYKMLEEGLSPREADIQVDEANVKVKIRMLQERYGWNVNLHSPIEHRNGTSLICWNASTRKIQKPQQNETMDASFQSESIKSHIPSSSSTSSSFSASSNSKSTALEINIVANRNGESASNSLHEYASRQILERNHRFSTKSWINSSDFDTIRYIEQATPGSWKEPK